MSFTRLLEKEMHVSRERSTVTSTVDAKGGYIFWDTKGNNTGKFPRHDPDAIADDMKCIFQIDRSYTKLNNVVCYGDNYYWGAERQQRMAEAERKFLVCLRKVLKENNIKAVIKAVGTASRGNKKAWTFYTTGYQIYANHGALVKLIGVNNLEEDTWKRLYKSLRRPYPES